jgi:hypothetical protein
MSTRSSSGPSTPRREYFVKTPVKRRDARGELKGTSWPTIGRAFEGESRDGATSINVSINTLPVGIGSDGNAELRLVLFEDTGERESVDNEEP